MPEIGKLKQVTQGDIRIIGVSAGEAKPVRAETASVEWAGATYDGAYTITPAEQEQILQTYGKILTQAMTVEAIPDEYRKVEGTITITENGSAIDVADYATANVAVPQPSTQTKSATPSESEQTVSPDDGYLLSSVTVGAVSSSYVGSSIPRKASSDLTASGATVTAPAGYYASDATKTVSSGTAGTPSASKGTVSNHAVTVTPSVTNTTGYIEGGTKTGTGVTVTVAELESGTKSISANGTDIDVSGYSKVDVAVPAPAPSLQDKSINITPTESAQTQTVSADDGYDGLDEVEVNVGAISSSYVGSGITRRSGTDLSASGDTVTVPAGYYAEQATKAVAAGSAGTPSASKGTVSNHSVTVTPSVTNSAGYISGGTKTGTGVTVNVSELESGTKSITANGTGISVSGYSAVDVAVPAPAPNLQEKTDIDPTTSSQTISADSGYDGLSSVQINAMPSGTAGTPIAAKGSVSNHQVYILPYVTNQTGYITGSTETGLPVTVSASELVSGTKTITASGDTDVTNYATASVEAQTLPTSASASATSGYYSKATIGRSTSDQYINIPTGYNASGAYYKVSAVANMTLPTSAAASATSGYTSKATISRSTSDQYINIPTGYNTGGAYYKVSAVANGTAGTPTATKGTVSNHSISVTPSVTNTTGYITGSTKTGTAVTVSASELVSGSETKTANGTYDVTNLAQLIVNVAGGGGSGLTYEQGTYTPTSDIARPTISFANSHSTTPILVAMSDTSSYSSITSNSNTAFIFFDMYRLTGVGFPYSTSSQRYELAGYVYRSSSSSTGVIAQVSYNSDNTGASQTTYSRYWVTESAFYPNSNSTSRYWRKNRSYKWIAVWGP